MPMESIRKLSRSFTKRRCSFRVVDIPTADDAEKLAELAKTKDVGLLAELGGVQGVISALDSDAELGIRGDTADLCHRTTVFGSNALRKSRLISSSMRVVFRDFKDYAYVVGVACAIYMFIASFKLSPDSGFTWTEGVFNLGLLFGYDILNNTIDLGLEIYLWKLNEEGDSVVVLRNGLKQLIPSPKVRVGDIVFLKGGGKIPGDGLLVDGDQPLKLVASNYSSTVVEVDSSKPFLSSGAIMLEGQAKMLIISVGKNVVCFGKHRHQVITRLEKEVDILIWYLERAKWIFPVIFLLVTLVRCFSGKEEYSDGYTVYDPARTGALESSYLVAEILYAAIIISLSLETTNFDGAMKVSLCRFLSRYNIIIRNLSALERIGLGAATVNVLVEQGTLSTYRVQASKFLCVPEIVENVEKEPFTISPNVAALVQQGIYLNTTGTVYRAQSTDKYQFSGNPCERATLSQGYLKLGMNWETLNEICTIRKVYSSDVQGRRILVQVNDALYLHRRGDAEVILKMCSSFYDSSGILCCLNENVRNLLASKLQSINHGGNANIALAHRLVSEDEFMTDPDLKEKENCYNLIGFIHLEEIDQDEILKRVKKELLDAGVRLNLMHRVNSTNRAAETETLESRQGLMVGTEDSRSIHVACEGEDTTEQHRHISVEDPESESMDQVTVTKFCLVKELTGNETVDTSTSPVALELLKQGAGLNTMSKFVSCVEFSKGPIGKAIISWAVEELKLDQELSIYRSEKLNLEEDQGLGFLMSLEDGTFLVHEKGSAVNILKMCSSYYCATGEQQVLGDPERMLLEHKVEDLESSKCRWVTLVHPQDEDRALWSLLGILILHQEKTEVPVNEDVSPAYEDIVSTEDACAGATDALGSDNGLVLEDVSPAYEDIVSTEDAWAGATDALGSDNGLVLEQINGPDIVIEDEDELEISSEAVPVLVSMGIEDDTRKTSDIVILDGNYSCLPLILGWSRCILHNSQLFLQYQITTSITSSVFLFINYLSLPGIVGEEFNLTNEFVQMIWVNILMGLIAAVAFGRQKPQEVSNHAKQKQPAMADKEWVLINGFMVRNIVAQVAYQTIAMSILQFRGAAWGFDSKKMDTITTFTPVFLQAFNMVNARKIEEKNVFLGMQKWFTCLVAWLILVPLVATVFLPGIKRLSGEEWMLCLGIGVGTWPVCFVSKFVPLGWVVAPLTYVSDNLEKMLKATCKNLTGCRIWLNH